jgi:hypothetical protein
VGALQGSAATEESLGLLRQLASLLLDVSEGQEKPATYEAWQAPLFDAGLHRGRAADDHIGTILKSDGRTSPAALDDYLAYLGANGSIPDELRTPMSQILSYALHVRLTTPLDEARARAPRLERLHRARPKLTFPRLFLGRLRYLERDYAQASRLLAGVSGRLASSPKVLNVRGRCAEKLDNETQAISLFRRSLQEDRHQPHVHFRIGRLLLGRYKERAGDQSFAL